MDGAADSFDLPESIIHVVQSFLNSKEAARTTLLSKSWRSAWLTRPNLDFDLEDFRQRYENSNLNIHSFGLSIKNWTYSTDVFGILTKLIHRVLKLGPTRLTFEFANHYASPHLPNEVFRYESLLSLTAMLCRDIRGLSTPEIDNLTIHVNHEFMKTQNFCALLDGLLQICHPKVINIQSEFTYRTHIIILFLMKWLSDAKVPTPKCLNEYIKEARAQVFDGAVSTWRDITFESLLDQGSTTIRNYRALRLRLNRKERVIKFNQWQKSKASSYLS